MLSNSMSGMPNNAGPSPGTTMNTHDILCVTVTLQMPNCEKTIYSMSLT